MENNEMGENEVESEIESEVEYEVEFEDMDDYETEADKVGVEEFKRLMKIEIETFRRIRKTENEDGDD